MLDYLFRFAFFLVAFFFVAFFLVAFFLVAFFLVAFFLVAFFLVAIKISLFNVKFRFSALTLSKYSILNVFNVKWIFIEKEAKEKNNSGGFFI